MEDTLKLKLSIPIKIVKAGVGFGVSRVRVLVTQLNQESFWAEGDTVEEAKRSLGRKIKHMLIDE